VGSSVASFFPNPTQQPFFFLCSLLDLLTQGGKKARWPGNCPSSLLPTGEKERGGEGERGAGRGRREPRPGGKPPGAHAQGCVREAGWVGSAMAGREWSSSGRWPPGWAATELRRPFLSSPHVEHAQWPGICVVRRLTGREEASRKEMERRWRDCDLQVQLREGATWLLTGVSSRVGVAHGEMLAANRWPRWGLAAQAGWRARQAARARGSTRGAYRHGRGEGWEKNVWGGRGRRICAHLVTAETSCLSCMIWIWGKTGGYTTTGWIYIKRASAGDGCRIRRGSRHDWTRGAVAQPSVRRRLSQTDGRQG
jgi:hypothetical protein